MTISESLKIWRRRWKLTVALLILALTGAAVALTGLPRTYQANSSVIMLASRSAARLNGGNPYLSFSPSLTLTADALSKELMAPGTMQDLAARGFSGTYTVVLAPYTTTTTGSVLLVTAAGSDRAAVEQTLHGVTAEISATLARWQKRVTARNRIRALTLSFSPQATLSVSQTARPLVVVIVPVLLLALGIPIVADGRIARRRIRRHAAQSEAGPDSAGQPAYARRGATATRPQPQPQPQPQNERAAAGNGDDTRRIHRVDV